MNLSVKASEWSGLNQAYSLISNIELEDKPFSSGGFGEVYHCISINGSAITQDLVIKIFTGNKAAIDKGLTTIDNLQAKIGSKARELRSKGKTFLDIYPAMLACPQFSFQGKMRGKKVVGYAALNLKSLGFEEFKDVLSDLSLLKHFRSLTLKEKFSIAHQLVSSFELLKEFLYIHADFKADALFVNLNSKSCAIIDFDSGAVMQSINDRPTTWGALQDWLAPEIFKQIDLGQSNRKKANQAIEVKVDLFSDMWSVAVCIHFFIFTFHPFFFFF